MLKKYGLVILIVMLATALLVGCHGRTRKSGKGEDKESGSAKAAYTSKGDEGTVTGKVMFEGTPPVFEPIDMSQDAVCAGSADKTPDNVHVKDGKVKFVFVYLKGAGVDNYKFPTGDAITLDQKGCRYDPHVLGLQTGQTLKITNSDNTTHNVHPSPQRNDDFNKSQPPNSPAIEHKFNNKEVLIPVKCNQHPWMKASIGVLDHPFFAVSAEDGSFTIKGVPPGDYTLVFWHEVFGEQTQNIKVAANGTVTQDMTYKAGSAAKPATFLQIEPTLVLP
jgi:predicted small secreted protein